MNGIYTVGECDWHMPTKSIHTMRILSCKLQVDYQLTTYCTDPIFDVFEKNP